jgi:hypothetical protein
MLALGVLTVLAGRAQSVSDNDPVAPYPAVSPTAQETVWQQESFSKDRWRNP